MVEKQLNFSNISPGYLGLCSKVLTLNSEFFSETLKIFESEFEKRILLTPQRIPRIGFFDELNLLETIYFNNEFKKIVNSFADRFKNIKDSSKNYDLKNLTGIKNQIDFMMRLGIEFEFPDFTAERIPTEDKFLLRYKKIIFQNHLNLSKSQSIQIKPLIDLFNDIENEQNISLQMLRNQCLSRLIVTHYRHSNNTSNEKKIFELSDLHLKEVDNLQPKNEQEVIWKSMIFRALPMLTNISIEQKIAYMHKSVETALTLNDSVKIDKIIKYELLATTYQSFAKLYLYNKDLKNSLKYLNKVIELDPFDSSIHTEFGFFYYKQENWKEAKNYFEKAFYLGPPSPALNAFYAGICCLKLFDELDAINWFKHSMASDNQALSPLIELFKIYKKNDNSLELEHIKKELSKPIFLEQMDEVEKNEIFKN